jgi:predicted Zn-dependent protease
MLSDLAKYAALHGETEASLSLAERACRVATRYERPVELYMRRLDHGQLLLAAGRPGEALRALPDPDAGYDSHSLPGLWLLRAEAHRQAGDRAAAHDALQQAAALIEAEDRKRLRPKVEALARQL